MRFLANENFPFPSTKILRTFGLIIENHFSVIDEQGTRQRKLI